MNYTKYDGPKATANRSQDFKDYASLIVIVGQIIREAKQIPSGTIYAQVMGTLDLRTYNNIIAVLMRTGLVKERNYLLTWVGPEATVEKEYRAPIKPTQRWFKSTDEE